MDRVDDVLLLDESLGRADRTRLQYFSRPRRAAAVSERSLPRCGIPERWLVGPVDGV